MYISGIPLFMQQLWDSQEHPKYINSCIIMTDLLWISTKLFLFRVILRAERKGGPPLKGQFHSLRELVLDITFVMED